MQESVNKVNQWLHDRVQGEQLDNDGVTSIQRDPETIIVLEVLGDSEICHLCAPVAPLPADSIETSLYTALELNQFGRPLGGFWLAWNPDIQMLTLCKNLHVTTSSHTDFNNTLDNFIVSIDKARKIFTQDFVPTKQDFAILHGRQR